MAIYIKTSSALADVGYHRSSILAIRHRAGTSAGLSRKDRDPAIIETVRALAAPAEQGTRSAAVIAMKDGIMWLPSKSPNPESSGRSPQGDDAKPC